MKLISWNVRGCSNKKKQKLIGEIVKEKGISVLGLQETKLDTITPIQYRRLGGGRLNKWIERPAEGASGGVLMGWDERVWTVEDVQIGTYSISAQFTGEGRDQPWGCCIFYGPIGNSQGKIEARRELSGWLNRWNCPYVIIGDFNCIREPREKSTRGVMSKEMRDFTGWVETEGVMELQLNDLEYTWSNMRRQPIFSKIDRCFISSDWDDHFEKTHLGALPRVGSDHVPLLLETGEGRFLKPFRMESYWLGDESFCQLVKDSWRKEVNHPTAMGCFAAKIKRMKKDIIHWKGNRNKEL